MPNAVAAGVLGIAGAHPNLRVLRPCLQGEVGRGWLLTLRSRARATHPSPPLHAGEGAVPDQISLISRSRCIRYSWEVIEVS
ncbi:hypothetical protein HDE77_000287 [Rhodanobacter sp. MP7CTX1]|jgi:hypothetical protein|nr:hypothetical protein [Rhodanobacter sp. MP7CTX1]